MDTSPPLKPVSERSVASSITLSLYLPTLILSLATGMLTPIMPLYAQSFGLSYGLIGIVLSAQGIGNFIGDIPAGILLSRLGHKWTMLIGVAFFGLAICAMSWAQSAVELTFYGLLAGFGNAMWNISRHAYMTDLIPLSSRGRATATFGGLNRIGSFGGPFIGGALAGFYGMRLPFVVFGVVALTALILSALFVNEAAAPHTRRGGLRGHTLHLAHITRTYAYILSTAGIAQLFAQMIRTGRNSMIPLYAADVVGLNVQQVSWVIGLAAAIDVAMFYPAGLIMDRYGRKYASVPSFLIQGIGMALVPLTLTFGGLLAATLVIGFGNGLGSGSMLTLGSDLAPRGSVGEFLGVWRLIGDVGQTSAPLAVGGVAQLLSLSMSTLVLAGVGIAAGLVLAWFVPETLRPPASAVEVKV